MKDNNKLCCIVLNYNDSKTVEEFIANIHDYKCIGDIVIVDNCSTDDSYINLKKYENERIHVIRTEQNGGYGYGNNRGIEFSRGLNYKYAVISNPDVYFGEETIEECLKCMFENPNCAVSAPVQYNLNNSMILDFAWKMPNALQYACSGTRLEKIFDNRIYNFNEMKMEESYKVDCVPGACLVINIDKFMKSGGYDERIFLFCEETIIGKRITDSGFETRLVPLQKYIHKESSSVDKSEVRSKKEKMILENRLFYINNYLNENWITKTLARIILWYRIGKL